MLYLPVVKGQGLREAHFCSAEPGDTAWEATISLKTPEAAIIYFLLQLLAHMSLM